jgi:AraC-like DNA-binding protein
MLRQLEIGPGGLAAVLDDEHHIVALLDHDSGIEPDRLARLATGELSSIPGRMLVRATSDLNGWSYLALGNPAVVMRPVVALRRIFIVLFIVSLLGGFAMAYSMARKRSLPLFQLACRLSSSTRPEQQQPTGSIKAYQSIEQGVEQMLQSNLTLQEKLRAVNPTLLSAFVHQLLNGEFIQEAEVLDAVRRYEVSLPRQPYCLVSFYMPQLRGLFAQSREQVLQAMTAQDAVAECLHYLIDGSLLLSKAGVDETIWIHSMADNTDEQDLLDLLDKVARWFDEHQITMSIRYSRRYSELSNSWWELAQLRHASQGLKAVPQSSRIELVWSDPDADRSQYMQLVEMLLQSMFQSGDERMLARFLDIVRTEIFTDSRMDVAARQVLIQQFHELAVRLTGQPIDLAEPDDSDPAALFAQVSAVILVSSKAAGQVRLKTGSFLLSKIHRYVEQQLYNPDLSMTLIADAMSISENYLSRFFKEQCGETLASFIENGRIRQAQEQLLQTMRTVSEIAAVVGYNSDHVFRRAFRRVTGLSPNEYRERNSSS